MNCSGESDYHGDGNMSRCTPNRGCGLTNCPDLQARQQRQNQELGEAIAKTYQNNKSDPPRDLEKIWNQCRSLRASGNVKRWHTLPIIGQQTVAEHSGQAVSLLLLLHPNPSLRLIKAVMWHDSSERAVGDVPATARRYHEFYEAYSKAENEFMMNEHPSVYDAIAWLDPVELNWLKAVDLLELIMFCDDQFWLGNRQMKIVQNRAIAWMKRNENTPIEVQNFLAHYEINGPGCFA